MKPLEGLRVLDFAQFLAGPMAALRLADLGAEVIKIERPGIGDLCRTLVISDQKVGPDSLLFHTINRNKASIAADLKDAFDLEKVKDLLKTSDVMIHNFRPGVMERIGLGWEDVRKINSRLVYGAVTGYGTTGPWVKKPGQDLLVQSLTGMPWLSGDLDHPPIPAGFAVLDITCGNHLVQGVLAALLRREKTGNGGLVEVDLMSSAIDMQFELFTAFLNGDGSMSKRSAISNANASVGAPYGIYACQDGYIAIAMAPISALADLLDCKDLVPLSDPEEAFKRRDEIKAVLRDHLTAQTVAYWLERLEPADIWCSKVLDWPELIATEGFAALDMLQTITAPDGTAIKTTRCPIRIDGETGKSDQGGPALGADTDIYLN
ncbi:CaiB/BaiF CoA-transferase family protein [Roseibium sp. HPY-6]|uniref:CaiB/BaiF CoA transferase family protein n=1 Tax=Roseibium sp. HPY-6 TaxID=3229852 RepID=UPI00338DDA10